MRFKTLCLFSVLALVGCAGSDPTSALGGADADTSPSFVDATSSCCDDALTDVWTPLDSIGADAQAPAADAGAPQDGSTGVGDSTALPDTPASEDASGHGDTSVAQADGGPAGTDIASVDAAPDAAADGASEDAAATDVGDAGGGNDATADVSDPFEPAPIPALSEEPASACAAAIADPWYFQFLDNLCDEKVWPTAQDRDRKCPAADDSPFMTLKDGTTVEYHPSSVAPVLDTTALSGLVPSQMNVVVILIKRVGGVPHYRYLASGGEAAFQPWSTTKFLAAANAAATLRIESGYQVGLTAKVGSTPVGDLVTSVHNYDDSPYSSNSLAAWFHDVGGRAKANALMHDLWLHRPATETFGGNYGSSVPALGYTFTEPGGASVTIAPDKTTGPANHLSAFTLAEGLKRLVLHREEETQRLPGIQWLDLRVLLYGAESSPKYGMWGGMTADTSIYLQSGHDIGYIEERSHGQWVIFSKLGLGSQGQFADVGYACFPVLDDDGQPVPGWGREFLIAAHLPSGGATWDDRDRLLAKTYRKIILRIVDGRL